LRADVGGNSRRNLLEPQKQSRDIKQLDDKKRASADVRVQRIGQLILELLLSLVLRPCIIFIEDAQVSSLTITLSNLYL
jgi:hypothetical protein